MKDTIKMLTIWFTSDTHFGHYNIMKHCNRPFESVDEMNKIIIDNWNSKVKKTDLVYHLGDICFKQDPIKYLEKLNGNIILIKGNHDHRISQKCKCRLNSIFDLHMIKIKKQPIVLCHYAMRTWNLSCYNSFHLYGHSHGTLKPIGKSWDVGVDNNNFYPISSDEIFDIMNNSPNNIGYINGEKNAQ